MLHHTITTILLLNNLNSNPTRRRTNLTQKRTHTPTLQPPLVTHTPQPPTPPQQKIPLNPQTHHNLHDPGPTAAAVCTMELSKIYLPAGRHSLVAAARRAGVELGHHHRALADAWTAAELLRVYLAAESSGRRFSERAVSRRGEVTEPASWVEAQLAALNLSWPKVLL